MFGKLGKQYANVIGDAVEDLVGKQLAANMCGRTEEATEKLGHVSGKRKALLIGINYVGQQGELRGCLNDVKNIKNFLTNRYQVDEMLVLTDGSDQNDASKLPTRANIIAGFRWLRQGVSSGDSLILHYSGHGGSQEDLDGDEEDGMDETLIPVDHATAGVIVDDDVHDILVRGLPKGVRLTAIMDCCHSESMLDLPYIYNINGDLEIIESNKKEGISILVGTGVRLALSGDKKRAFSTAKKGVKKLLKGDKEGNSEARQKTIETRSTEADVIQFSGCRDDQTSADAHIDGQATGAMSYALIRALSQEADMDYTELLKSMRQILEGKYTQVPMMSAGRKLDLNNKFSI